MQSANTETQLNIRKYSSPINCATRLWISHCYFSLSTYNFKYAFLSPLIDNAANTH